MADIEKITKMNDMLNSQNANWRSYWQDLANYCLPRKSWITSMRTIGERVRFNFLYDSTAIRALKIMAAGFHSNLTNPSTKWFGFQTFDENLMENRDVALWFKEAEDKVFSILNNSNFDTVMQEFYMDVGCFGTGTVLSLEDTKSVVRFTTVPIEQINLAEDSNGRVNELYRNFKLTADQAYGRWGKDSGKAVLEKYKNRPYDMMDFCHYVGPRDKYDIRLKDNKNMEYTSCWISKEDKHELEESGFQEFPYHVGRFWKDANECFGFSPAMDVFPDIKLVNAQQRTLLRAAMKQADPPMQAPSKGYILPLNFNPAAVNYRDEKVAADSLQAIDVGRGNIPITIEVIKMVMDNIDQGFYVPLFKALSTITKQMTVPEVQRRVMENMVLLGPVVGRFTQEMLDPLIIRVFNIAVREGLLSEPPEDLQGQGFRTVYLSPLAKAQRESDLVTVESFLGTLSQVAAIKPGVLDKINEDKTVDVIARIKGVTPEILRSAEEVEAIREQRAQMEAAAMKMQAVQSMVGTAKVGTEAMKNVAGATAA